MLLIPISVLFSTIRALPGNPIAGHTPDIRIHAVLANGKPAPAIPAKHKCLTAAMALLRLFSPSFFFSGFGVWVHGTNIYFSFNQKDSIYAFN
jgi:hypothetical protein